MCKSLSQSLPMSYTCPSSIRAGDLLKSEDERLPFARRIRRRSAGAMGKSELKAMANRAKAKGLQKLRWYCQMCEKQCRDENGFRCHCSSESHRRQMAVFGQAPGRAVERFSGEFLEAFLALLRHGHRGSRVAATVVYSELVADRRHVHMNSTRWATLTEFVELLGRQGLARVEHTPKGWPGSSARGAKDRSNRKDHWLSPGIVVKVMSKSLAEKGHHYYKHKGLVRRVIGRYVGEIEMLESKHVARVDQDELETVIPQIGGLVRVVNGAYRGSNARLLSVDMERFSARLRVEKGFYEGRVLEAVEYEDICKVA
ncbi:KIN17-like protein [Triticum aestivum]|uniref:KIN17-like protein n=1 Tax=Triticum aestivum TaxID=4565 RepID=UPI001D01F464|nr:KIN17-like protein [Triticum aestivum]